MIAGLMNVAEKDQLGFFLLAAPIPLPRPFLVFLFTIKMGMLDNFVDCCLLSSPVHFFTCFSSLLCCLPFEAAQINTDFES
jgi:hypothetical protein